MATPSRIDSLLDDAQLAREDALGQVLDAQHALHNSMTALRAAWDALGKVECAMAGEDGRGEPGMVFRALASIRSEPAVRRAGWDGSERRVVAL